MKCRDWSHSGACEGKDQRSSHGRRDLVVVSGPCIFSNVHGILSICGNSRELGPHEELMIKHRSRSEVGASMICYWDPPTQNGFNIPNSITRQPFSTSL